MSTPSTVTAVHPPHHFYPHYPNYQALPAIQRQKPPSSNDLQALAYPAYNNNNNVHNNNTNLASNAAPHPASAYNSPPYPFQRPSHVSEPQSMSDLSPPKIQRSANWKDFYKNGLPTEVIVIEDDSPERQVPMPSNPVAAQPVRPAETAQSAQPSGFSSNYHLDKRRRVDASPKTEVAHRHLPSETQQQEHNLHASTSRGTASSGRRTSALYSTAPTSLGASASAGQPIPVREDAAPGQKRKRPARTAEEDAEQLELIAQHRTWSNYFPPPNPPIKAHDVFVVQIRDVRFVFSVTFDSTLTLH